jgi:hypothetical protein
MAVMTESLNQKPTEIAAQIARLLESSPYDYAIGGALALGLWTRARGTEDVDVTIYADASAPVQLLNLLRDGEVEFIESKARETIREYGFFRAALHGVVVDVFLPTIPVYELCRQHRERVEFAGQPLYVFGPLAVSIFKMMFFRQQDLVDVENMLRTPSTEMDTQLIREQLVDIFGQRDPRVSTWDEIVARTRG